MPSSRLDAGDREHRGRGGMPSLDRLAARQATLERVGRTVGGIIGNERWTRIAPQARALSFAALQRIWHVAAAAGGGPDLGFRVAKAFGWGERGLVDELLLCAPSYRVIVESYARWGRLAGEFVRHEGYEDGDWFRVRTLAPAGVEQHRASQDLYAARGIALLRTLRRRPEGPRAMYFKYPCPKYLSRHREVFGPECTLHFGHRHLEMVLPIEWVDEPLPGSDVERFEQLQQRVDGLLRRSEDDLAFLNRVSDQVLRSLEQPGPSLAEVAGSLGLHERTLRRRLDGLGLPWRRLLDEVRATLLESERLERPLKQREAARLLGFANVGAMRRAVRRWADV